MHKLKLLPFLVLFLSFTFVSCDKDDDPPAPSREELLTSKSWQATQIFVSGQNVTQAPGIDVDNTSIKFDSNGRYNFNLLGDPFTGTWEFTSNEQAVILDKGTQGELTVDILELTANKLNLEFTFEDNGTPYPVEIRFVPS